MLPAGLTGCVPRRSRGAADRDQGDAVPEAGRAPGARVHPATASDARVRPVPRLRGRVPVRARPLGRLGHRGRRATTPRPPQRRAPPSGPDRGRPGREDPRGHRRRHRSCAGHGRGGEGTPARPGTPTPGQQGTRENQARLGWPDQGSATPGQDARPRRRGTQGAAAPAHRRPRQAVRVRRGRGPERGRHARQPSPRAGGLRRRVQGAAPAARVQGRLVRHRARRRRPVVPVLEDLLRVRDRHTRWPPDARTASAPGWTGEEPTVTLLSGALGRNRRKTSRQGEAGARTATKHRRPERRWSREAGAVPNRDTPSERLGS